MTISNNTFKDFFKTKFLSERAYMKFNPHHFERIYYEMAKPGVGKDLGDVVKRPISIDKEDLDFLKQFPQQYWKSALAHRFELLHQELVRLHKKRKSLKLGDGENTTIGYAELRKKIENAIDLSWLGNPTGWDSLDGVMSKDVLHRLKNTFTQDYIQSLGDNRKEIRQAIKDEADKEAYEEVKANTEEISESPEPVEFKFKNKSYFAKPFLNRLYHKLERTKGLPHHPSAGLKDFEEIGGYGYDLGFPQAKDLEGKIKRTTRGAGSWPSSTTVNSAVNDLWNLNQHHIFGDLEVPNGAVWKPIHGEKKNTFLKDFHLWNQREDKYFKKFEGDLSRDVSKKFATVSERRAEAKRLAKEATMKDVEDGKLVGPPVPGVAPEARVAKIEGGKVVLPNVYLPHIKTKVKTKGADGQIYEEDDWVPVVNPAHFYRALGSEEKDYKVDDDGRRTGELNIDAIRDRMTGIPDESGVRPYVKVNPEEYQKSGGMGHQAPASFHLNQNSKGRYFISRGDPDYKIYYDKVFGDMQLKTDESGAKLYSDFRKGILRCIKGDKCGGAGQTERSAILQDIPALHDVIVMHARNNLADPRLHSDTGRVGYAESFTGQFAQQNLGDGTRRKRILDKTLKNVSRDKTATGSEGGTMGIGDSLDSQAVDKYDHSQTGRERGGRIIPSMDWLGNNGQTSYNVDAFRKIVRQMEHEAKLADASSKEVKLTPDDIEKLKNSILDRANVIDAIQNHLIRLYTLADPSRQNVKKDTEDEVKDWILDGARTSEALIRKFESHPLVTQIVGNPVAEVQPEPEQIPQAVDQGSNEPLTDDAKFVIDEFKSSDVYKRMKAMQGTGDWNSGITILSAKPGEKYSGFAEKFAQNLELDPETEELSLTQFQDFINREFGLTNKVSAPKPKIEPDPEPRIRPTPSSQVAANPQLSIAAREIELEKAKRNPANDLVDINNLIYEKRVLDLALHPKFISLNIQPKAFESLKNRIIDYHQRGLIDQNNYNAAMANITRKQQLMSGGI